MMNHSYLFSFQIPLLLVPSLSHAPPAFNCNLFTAELERLEMNDCGIRVIEAHAFKGLTKLQYLYLAANRLSTLPRDTFADMEGIGNLR